MNAPDRQTFRLVHERSRQLASLACVAAPDGYVVTIRPPTRSLEQNAMLHAALADIAKKLKWHGKRLELDVWKRLCTAAWLREIGESPEMIPALDGKGFDVIFERTSQLTVVQMTSLIEWVIAFAVQNGVELHDPAEPPVYAR